LLEQKPFFVSTGLKKSNFYAGDINHEYIFSIDSPFTIGFNRVSDGGMHQ